jgi:spore coat polysaccharide biosynthesis protein SpsF
MRVAAVILARVGSTRLERKVLRDLGGMPLVAHTLRRAKSFPGVSDGGGVVLAIPVNRNDDELVPIGEKYGATVFRGDEDDVLLRLIMAAETVGADIVYRITADNPLVDQGVVSGTWDAFSSADVAHTARLVRRSLSEGGSDVCAFGWDYSVMEETPLGTTAEVVTMDALRRASEIADIPRLREHPTLAMYENSELFRMLLVPSPEKWRHPEWRFTVDNEADFQVVKTIMEKLGVDATLDTIVPFLLEHPEIAAINSTVAQKGWEELKGRKDAIGHV